MFGVVLVREAMKHVLAVSLSIFLPTTFALAQVPEVVTPAEKSTVDEKPKKKKKHSFADVSVKDLQAAIAASSVTIIDANKAEKFNKGHIPGALHFAEIKGDKLADSLPKDKAALIVAYCSGPQ